MIQLPDLPRREYKNTFLSRVIIQVRFAPIVRIAEEVSKLQAELRDVFPVYEPPDGVTLRVSPGSLTGRANATHKFKTVDGGQWVEVLPDRVTYLADEYPGWEKASKAFFDFVDWIWQEFSPPHVTRVGVRYQDVIEKIASSPRVWRDYIREDLLTLTTSSELENAVASSEHSMLLRHEDAALHFQWTMRAGTTQGGEPVQRLDLDFDMFADSVGESWDDSKQRFQEHHELVIRFFEWVITDALRAEME